jgi:TRAP-type C4-dicarboxylate transport system permease small subunit
MKRVITFLEYVGGGLLFVVMVLITASAVCRYVLNAPLLDSDDIARLLLLHLLRAGGCLPPWRTYPGGSFVGSP